MATKRAKTAASDAAAKAPKAAKSGAGDKVCVDDAAAAKACDLPVEQTDEGYMRGFGGNFSTECLKGVIPARGNTPQRVRFVNCVAQPRWLRVDFLRFWLASRIHRLPTACTRNS